MLAKINLDKRMSKSDYQNEISSLELKMKEIQLIIQARNIPVSIVFEGWGSSGKGTFISKVVHPLDPRFFNVYTMDKVNEDMAMRPYLWSYWTKLPSNGRMALFDKSWHRILNDNTDKWKLRENERLHFYDDINAFERQLTDSGMVIIKFFLHISKEEQKRRYKDLESRRSTSWRVGEDDWKQNADYNHELKKFENIINATNTAESPWHIIEAEDKRFATIKIYKIIIRRLENEIRKQFEPNDGADMIEDKVSILSSIDLSKEISKKEYKDKLTMYQKKLALLCSELYAKRRSVVIVYEGWDAAGKGGNIKRVTQELDPRGYEVVPVAAPTPDELANHYLWRFWQKIPKDGHVAIFDRSWYGRVMVERVESFCTKTEWKRAYREINDMEKNLYNHDIKVFKFWIHVDKEVQLQRFKERQTDPLKQHKITDEDWRNHEKWEQYEDAVNEMLIRTNTEFAPWTIVESNCKRYARIKVLEKLTTEMEKWIESI